MTSSAPSLSASPDSESHYLQLSFLSLSVSHDHHRMVACHVTALKESHRMWSLNDRHRGVSTQAPLTGHRSGSGCSTVDTLASGLFFIFQQATSRYHLVSHDSSISEFQFFFAIRLPPAMASIDSKADFEALLTELGLPTEGQQWLKDEGFVTISDLVFTFVASTDGESLLQKIPSSTWSKLGIDISLEDPSTTVIAGKFRRLLAQCRMVMQQTTSGQPEAALPSTPATPLTQPMWNELAPPRLTPEAVTHLMDQFAINYPGELLTADSTPSIRLLSVVHHTLKPGQALKYIPWQIRMSQKQYQEMTEAKTHKAIRSEAQILGALLDETPEIPVENMRLSAEWLLRTQQVFRNAWVMCGAAHLHIFKKYDDKFFSLAMKKHAPESMLRSVNLSELLEADKFLWGETISLVNQKWKLDDALHEMSSARADMYGVLQPRPKAPLPKPPKPDPPTKPPKADPLVKKNILKNGSDSGAHQMDLCTFMWANGKKQTLCQRFQKGTCNSKSCKYYHACAIKVQGKPCGKNHGAHAHGNKT